MKKIILVFIVCLLLVGCSTTTNNKVKKHKKTTKVKEKYEDKNNMPIGIYKDENSKLNILINYSNIFVRGTDIGVFQIYPSTDSSISYNGSFANSFYEKWSSKNNNHKIGFLIEYDTKNDNKIYHTILKPSDTKAHENYLEIYLYDDYVHRNDSFYSHVEEKDYNDNTLYTSIKLTPGIQINDITSDIKLTVFTYDGKDDFDSKDGLYRGKSKYTINVSRTN